MKIAIIGAGAMGCLYGAKLSENKNNQIWLIDVWDEHIAQINGNGLLVKEGEEFTAYENLTACKDPEEAGKMDLVIVFVKSIFTKSAVEANLPLFGTDTIILTLQNGLGNVDQIAEVLGDKNIIAGTTGHGATMLGPGKILHAGKGDTVIGELNGEKSLRTKMLAELFVKAGIRTLVSGDVMGLIWDKLLTNVGINALSGITGLTNGELLDYPEIEELLEKAVEEAADTARAKGIKLGYENPIECTKELCRATGSNKSSMLQDLLNGRKTEIDMINGAVVREGKAVGVDTPVNGTLTNLIKFLERSV